MLIRIPNFKYVQFQVTVKYQIFGLTKVAVQKVMP